MIYQLKNIVLRYGTFEALSISSLSFISGEMVALLGPNGSGKTSLLKLLDGLILPYEGTIICSDNCRSVYLHQFPYILSGTVGYNVGIGCRAMGLDRHETKRRVEESISVLGLESIVNRTDKALSGGEAQRVALARAMATKPEILLLDEPSSSADASSVVLIAEALRVSALSGTTIILSTHDEEFSSMLNCKKIYLKKGKIDNTWRSTI